MTRARTPIPGRKVRGSTSGRPIMAALDLLGRRYALRVIWELREGPLAFRELATRCGGISPTSLNTRLGELREAGIIEGTPYQLSAQGAQLLRALAPLAAWAESWKPAPGGTKVSHSQAKRG